MALPSLLRHKPRALSATPMAGERCLPPFAPEFRRRPKRAGRRSGLSKARARQGSRGSYPPLVGKSLSLVPRVALLRRETRALVAGYAAPVVGSAVSPLLRRFGRSVATIVGFGMPLDHRPVRV